MLILDRMQLYIHVNCVQKISEMSQIFECFNHSGFRNHRQVEIGHLAIAPSPLQSQ